MSSISANSSGENTDRCISGLAGQLAAKCRVYLEDLRGDVMRHTTVLSFHDGAKSQMILNKDFLCTHMCCVVAQKATADSVFSE